MHYLQSLIQLSLHQVIKCDFNRDLYINFLGLVKELENAILDRRKGRFVPPLEAHKRVSKMYTWQNVARRTEIVYDRLSGEGEVKPLAHRLTM